MTKQAKKTTSTTLDGINNKLGHQLIISDLIYGIRKRVKIKDKIVVPELSLRSTTNETDNYNMDICIINAKNHKNYEVMIEVENMKDVSEKTKKKITDSFKKIPSLQEFFIIEWNAENKVTFTRYSRKNTKGEYIEKQTSKSEVLNYSLSYSLSSFRKTNLK